MSDPNQKHYRRLYRDEFKLAVKTLAGHNGALNWSSHDHIAFVFSAPTVCLVFYPHRTSAGNYHLRVRDQGSQDKKLMRELLTLLDQAAGYNCTDRKSVG